MAERRADSLREVLEAEIVTGELAPDTRLDEVSLCERFEASRTPVREALQQLAAAGLVELRPRRGAFVTRLEVADLLEMFETMAELEASCARFAARRMSGAEQVALREAHETCAQLALAGDADRYYRANARFHELIYKGAHNEFLSREIQRLRRRLQAYRRVQLRVRGRLDDSLGEHLAIVESIEVGDEQRAADIARTHVLVQGERFNDLVRQLRDIA